MKSEYESLIWLDDKMGREYVCHLDVESKQTEYEQLSATQKERCVDVTDIAKPKNF